MEEPEGPEIQTIETNQIAKVRDWFEENQANLRLPERGSNFKTKSEELILPFFEKEPDWDEFHHYYFPDGREVYEVSLKNAEKYFPVSLLDSFPNQKANEVVIQNIMFVEHPTLERFDPVIARYYPDNVESIKDFGNISYDGIPYDWSGTLDIWTYDEHHFIGFNFKDGELINHFRFNQNQNENARIAGDCYTIVREVSNNYTGSDGVVVVMPSTIISETFCTGSGGYNPTGGQGSGEDGEWHEYERPDCCDDPIPVPETELPTYDPPTIPSPATIINDLTNPCARDIFKELSKGSTYLTDLSGISGLDIFPGMLDLFEKSGKFDYRIRNGNLDSNLGGVTSPINNGIVTITLGNHYLQNATSLSIVRTIIHETIHAYLRMQTNPYSSTDKNTHQLLVEYDRKYSGSINDTHHSLMSQYILGMAVSLYNWDKKYGPTGGNLDFEYYYNMAFGGLVKEGTSELIDEAKPLIPSGSSWQEIKNIIENEATGNYLANGEKCN